MQQIYECQKPYQIPKSQITIERNEKSISESNHDKEQFNIGHIKNKLARICMVIDCLVIEFNRINHTINNCKSPT